MTSIPNALDAAPSPICVRGLIFDLDGTLVHTGLDIAAATNLMLQDLELAGYPEDQILTWVGNGVSHLVRHALTGFKDETPAPELLARGEALFRKHYSARICRLSRPYPDVLDTLNTLSARGFVMSCVTNKPEVFTHQILRTLDMDGYFQHVVGGDSLPEKKPHPLPLMHICQEMGISVSQAVLVGDSMNDIQAAQAAGMPIICVGYGYNQGMDLTKHCPNVIIGSFRELPGLLELHS